MPRVSIGLPVYNGENFLGRALESLLAQTFQDFELIVSDNASTDGTEDLCRKFASQDPRIRYNRNASNLGAARNFNRVFELSSGDYFKWASHDDVCFPGFLARCVAALEGDPGAVLAFPLANLIDAQGNCVEPYDFDVPPGGDSTRASRRFAGVLSRRGCYPVFGLMRASALRQTGLMGNYASADRVLLAQLSLLGRFQAVPERLLFVRMHPQRSVEAHPKWQQRAVWFDPTRAGAVVFPRWRIASEYVRAVSAARLGGCERACCYAHAAGWALRNVPRMLQDVLLASDQFLKGLQSPGKQRLAGGSLRS